MGARAYCIACDPRPTECLPFVRRTLVGDSGQKTQGFLAKLGLTRSYAASPAHGNCCARPSPDDKVSLLLTPPAGQGTFLRYVYQKGALLRAKTKAGKAVKVDANGIPV